MIKTGYIFSKAIIAIMMLFPLVTFAQFNLVSPPDNTMLTVEGNGSTTVDILWQQDNSLMGNVTYTWHLDLPGGNFSNPIVSVPSNNMAMDTVLTLDFNTINAVLEANGVMMGQTANLIWTVTATDGMTTNFAASPFNISLTRGSLMNAYDLLTPPDGTTLTVEGNGSNAVDIMWASSGSGVAYEWLLDLQGGDFSNPIISVPSNNMGMDTVLTLDFATIEAVLEGAGVTEGNTAGLSWRIHAFAGTDSLPSAQDFDITLTNGAVSNAYDLLTPPDGFAATIDNDDTQSVTIEWEDAGEGVTYGWLLDLAGSDFSNPVVGPLAANNNGEDAALTLDFATIYSVLEGAGVAEGATANLEWRVHAYAGTDSLVSTSTFTIDLTRGITSSVSEASAAEQVEIFPNPVNKGQNIMLCTEMIGGDVEIIDLSGKVVYAESITSNRAYITTNNLKTGIYLVRLAQGDAVQVSKLVVN